MVKPLSARPAPCSSAAVSSPSSSAGAFPFDFSACSSPPCGVSRSAAITVSISLAWSRNATMSMGRELGARCFLMVPMSAHGRTLGAITFVSGDRRHYDDDLLLAKDLGRRCAMALDDARLYAASQEAVRAAEAAREAATFTALRAEELPGEATLARHEAEEGELRQVRLPGHHLHRGTQGPARAAGRGTPGGFPGIGSVQPRVVTVQRSTASPPLGCEAVLWGGAHPAQEIRSCNRRTTRHARPPLIMALSGRGRG
jgi:hypothetical protein